MEAVMTKFMKELTNRCAAAMLIKGTTIDTLKLSGKFVFLLIGKYKVKLLINIPVGQVKQVELLDKEPMVQDQLVTSRYYTSTDLDQDGFNAEEDQFLFSASANTSDIISILQDLLAGKDISLLLAGASYQVRVSLTVYSTYLSHPRTMTTAVWRLTPECH